MFPNGRFDVEINETEHGNSGPAMLDLWPKTCQNMNIIVRDCTLTMKASCTVIYNFSQNDGDPY